MTPDEKAADFRRRVLAAFGFTEAEFSWYEEVFMEETLARADARRVEREYTKRVLALTADVEAFFHEHGRMPSYDEITGGE